MDRAPSRRSVVPSCRPTLLAAALLGTWLTALACAPEGAPSAGRAAPPRRAAATADVTDTQEVRRALEHIGVQLAEALRRGDAAAVTAHYTEDAVGYYPNEEAVRGREALRARLAGLLGTVQVLEARHAPDEVQVFGDVALEAGRYTYTLQPRQPGQAPLTDRGKYLIEWRRGADGVWRVRRDMDNSSLPGPR